MSAARCLLYRLERRTRSLLVQVAHILHLVQETPARDLNLDRRCLPLAAEVAEVGIQTVLPEDQAVEVQDQQLLALATLHQHRHRRETMAVMVNSLEVRQIEYATAAVEVDTRQSVRLLVWEQ
jgi:hypothetical protein